MRDERRRLDEMAVDGLAVRISVGVSYEGLPPAVAGALHSLLEGNLKKVLISLALWLPYLILSKRANVTFRHRLPD